MFDRKKAEAVLATDEYVVNVFPSLDDPAPNVLFCAYHSNLAYYNLMTVTFVGAICCIILRVGANNGHLLFAFFALISGATAAFLSYLFYILLAHKPFVPSLSLYAASRLTGMSEEELVELARAHGERLSPMTYRLDREGQNIVRQNIRKYMGRMLDEKE